MLFQTFHFLLFFLLLIVLLLVFRQHKSRKLVLLAASYIFYMCFNPVFIFLILYSTFIDFITGRKIYQSTHRNTARKWLTLSLIANLLVLVFFKYDNFFQDNMLAIFRLMGYQPSWTTVNVILPVGISFYTFQSLSYSIDIYRKKLTPTTSALDFALFVSFFPQLVAGPIVRAREFLPQLERQAHLKFDQEGLLLFLRGLFKKVVIADNLGYFVAAIYNHPDQYTSLIVWLAAFAFYIQVYCDFSGYSDMAIALGRMLGYRLPENFDHPYFAVNMRSFWHRWHISLSTWFRDYLYIPLGGSKAGPYRMYANLFVVFFISGLWHGAGWNFILWSIFMGLVFIAERICMNKRWLGIGKDLLLSWGYTQFCWLFSLLFFRNEGKDALIGSLKKFVLFDLNFSISYMGLSKILPFPLMMMVLFLVLHIFSWRVGSIDQYISQLILWKRVVAFIFMGMLLYLCWPTGERPFIYFQF